ncbi:MAG: hypothetical protein C4329_07510 [Chitinophagaceae bacterium]
MRKLVGLLIFLIVSSVASSQKVDSLYFNLYTDSLKKGFYNYINIEGKMSDGTWRPLDSNYIKLTTNAGWFRGNDLFIDSSYKGETVTVKAKLKSNPLVWKETIIYIRKRGFTEPLKTNEEILEEMRKTKMKVKTKSS